jgi:hypothetical protein
VSVFHVELRQFPHVARAFNLTREELDTRFIAPWVAGRPFEYDDRRWSAEKARLTIYRGPPLRTDEIGLGRGWANATRAGEDVTDKLLGAAPSPITPLKDEVVQLAAAGPLGIGQLLALTSARYPGSRVSERLALAERVVWELLHEERVNLVRGGQPVPRDGWQAELLALATWTEPGVTIRANPR